MDDDDWPRMEYPHPTTGYDWEPKRESRISARRDRVAPPALLLKIAKEARQHKEIWENFVAEREYWAKHGRRNEDGTALNSSMGGYYMLGLFYMDYTIKNRNQKNYSIYSKAALAKLMSKWASGEASLDDDANSIDLLDKMQGGGNTPSALKLRRTILNFLYRLSERVKYIARS